MNGSKSFDYFLSLLGDKVKLKGFDKYKGGLDNKSKAVFCSLFFFEVKLTLDSETPSEYVLATMAVNLLVSWLIKGHCNRGLVKEAIK